MAEVNKTAQVATGGTPEPEPEVTFENMSQEERFKRLSASGLFDKVLKPT